MRIRFTKDAIYETEGPGRGPRFAAGEVHDLREDLAHRWINRGLAVAEPEPEPAAEVASPPPPPAASPTRRASKPASEPAAPPATAGGEPVGEGSA